MRLYPSMHRIIETEKVKQRDIPLSCLVVDAKELDINLIREQHAAQPTRYTGVMPYDVFERADTYLFDRSGNRLSVADKMLRLESDYYFAPTNAVEFYPLEFEYNVLIKRELIYEPNKDFRIRVGCIDKEQELSKNLIKIFGDAHRRGIAPINISINDKDIRLESLANMSFSESDFIFIESADGMHYWDSNELINIDELLDNHCNVWMSVGRFEDLIEPSDSNSFNIAGSMMYNDESYRLKDYSYRFNLEKKHTAFDGYEIIHSFTGDNPIMILHKPQKGYVIISEKSLLQNAQDNYKFVYEVLVGTFCNSYYRTKWITGWITDQPVDYIAIKDSQFGRTHVVHKISDIIKNEYFHTGDDYALVEVHVKESDVSFQGIGIDGEILFKKIGGKPDPIKQDNMRSLYTTRRTIMHYEEYSINKVESELITQVDKTPMGNYIVIQPFKSTSLMIDSSSPQKIRIPDSFGNYLIVCKASIFSLVAKNSYTKEEHGVKMAELQVINRQVTKNYDVRTLGGGLPENEEPNYNLLDIGHVDGRPYRKGGAMVVTLPKKLEGHHELIQAAIEKHIASGDYYALVFE